MFLNLASKISVVSDECDGPTSNGSSSAASSRSIEVARLLRESVNPPMSCPYAFGQQAGGRLKTIRVGSVKRHNLAARHSGERGHPRGLELTRERKRIDSRPACARVDGVVERLSRASRRPLGRSGLGRARRRPLPTAALLLEPRAHLDDAQPVGDGRPSVREAYFGAECVEGLEQRSEREVARLVAAAEARGQIGLREQTAAPAAVEASRALRGDERRGRVVTREVFVRERRPQVGERARAHKQILAQAQLGEHRVRWGEERRSVAAVRAFDELDELGRAVRVRVVRLCDEAVE
mmetsp:Transcript_38361/g.95000  ORF Transcript_38361/g.95000 Transcript_38361/m.95000 type:complete len:295 (+) Transcript_38361:101-985(+)